jgi:aquaporin TIP
MATKHVDSFDEHDDVVDAGCVRAVLGELVLTFLFVFIGVAAAMAAGTHAPSPISRHLILQSISVS